MADSDRAALLDAAWEILDDYLTVERLGSIVDLIRAETLEQAARVAEFSYNRQYTGLQLADEIAAAIRALKDKSNG